MSENYVHLTERLKKYRHIFYLMVLCAALFFAKSKAGERLASVFSGEKKEGETVIVIDAGHGGKDPGKVGVSGTLEKDINLEIALKLKGRLEADGICVVMTRSSDVGLYSETAQNKKKEDMEARVRLIAETEPDFVVSIHQNSFSSEDCRGAQVFYYKESPEGKALAETLQNAFLQVLQDGNNRRAKANTDYYLLRKTACPIVIAECGFLSNPSEEALLATPEYQEKVAAALHSGIQQFISETKEQ